MKPADIIVTGIIGEKISEDIKRLFKEKYSLVVCSKETIGLLSVALGDAIKKYWIPFTPLQECYKKIDIAIFDGSVIVITSGDSLFFGFGSTIKKRFPNANIQFIPSISSMQICFSRFGLSWDEASCISLHGRPLEKILSKLSERILFAFTDKNNNPSKIAQYIKENINPKNYRYFKLYVGEKLGTKDEKLFRGDLNQTANQCFEQPNCVIIKNECIDDTSNSSKFGLKEDQIFHSRGLITKNEIRAVVLHSLDLPAKGVFWDIGAGSGSISLEAARINPELAIYSIERNPEEITNISQNINSFSCRNVTIIPGLAPDVLDTLPEPDRIFIGGSGGKMDSIIKLVSKKIFDEKKVVITGVTEKTCTSTPKILKKYGMSYKTSIVSVNRTDDTGKKEKLNTIHIIQARKNNGR